MQSHGSMWAAPLLIPILLVLGLFSIAGLIRDIARANGLLLTIVAAPRRAAVVAPLFVRVIEPLRRQDHPARRLCRRSR